MAHDPYEFQVKACLEELGYTVSAIDEVSYAKRADLLAQSQTDTLIVEVKCRYDDEEIYNNLLKIPTGQSLPYQSSVQRKNSLAAMIKDASRQIEKSRCLSPDAFGILWFHPDPKLGLSDSDEQIKMNLYGGRYAFVDAPDGSHLTMPCYYATYSDFFRYRNLEGMILHVPQGVQLYPNPFSTKATDFKRSRLYQDSLNHSAIWYPELLAEKGNALYLNDQVNLKDEDAVKLSLEQHHPGYKIVTFIDVQSLGGVIKF